MLPPTSVLRNAGAAGGAGLGHLLGGVLDAPRRALTNGVISPVFGDQIAQAQGAAPGQQDDADSVAMRPAVPPKGLLDTLMAMGPAALGGAAAGAALFTPAAPLAGLIGAGVGGLAQMAGDALAPETFGAPTADQIVRALSVDPDTARGAILSMGVGMATDPLTYAGALGGSHAGAAVGGAADSLAARGAQAAEMESRAQQLQQLGATADAHLASMPGEAGPKNPWLSALVEDATAPPPQTYRADVQASMPDLLNQPWGQKTYKQVDPMLGQDLSHLGLASPAPGGGMSMTTGQAPDFAQARGGWLKPTRAREAMLAGGDAPVLGLPGTAGPNLPRDRGYMGTLENPTQDFLDMRQGSGMGEALGGGGAGGRPEPTLASLMGQAAADEAAQRMPWAMTTSGSFPGGRALGGTGPARGHVIGLPAGDARSAIQQMLEQAQAQAGQLQQPQGALQKALLGMGLVR